MINFNNVLDRSPITRELVEEGELVILRAKYSLEIGEVAVLTRVDASNVAEMAVVGVEKVAAAESEETAETTIPEDIIPEISEPESSMSEDVISEEEAA